MEDVGGGNEVVPHCSPPFLPKTYVKRWDDYNCTRWVYGGNLGKVTGMEPRRWHGIGEGGGGEEGMVAGHGGLWARTWAYMHMAGMHVHGGMWVYRFMVVCVYGVGLIWEINSYVWVQHAEMARVQASALQWGWTMYSMLWVDLLPIHIGDVEWWLHKWWGRQHPTFPKCSVVDNRGANGVGIANKVNKVGRHMPKLISLQASKGPMWLLRKNTHTTQITLIRKPQSSQRPK